MLPINTMPVYTTTIPSTKKIIKYRQFLVKEEKALLIAQESEEVGVLVDTVKSVIRSCTNVEGQAPIDPDTLASFDIEYLFLQMRIVSVGELVDLKLACDTCTDEKAFATIHLDLRNAKIEQGEGHTPKIPLFDDVGVVMKYPTLNTVKGVETFLGHDLDQSFEIVADCIDYIYSGEEVFTAKETSRDELLKFLNNLTGEQFERIEAFYETMPRLKTYMNYKCPVCGKEHDKYLEGLSSFFS